MEFYLKYLADNRPPKIPQTRPMSVGSAFDAYVKSYLVERLLGRGKLPEFELDTIFKKQVEPCNRDWALAAGKHAFECYKLSGALADLMIELEQADATPRFEFTVQRVIDDIPLLGKPDVWFITKDGTHVLIDWKVNGYCSKRQVSPKKSYIWCADGWEGAHSRSHRTAHKDAQVMMVGGIKVNLACHLEDVNLTWANQTCLYGWLMGEEIGSKFICGIDQLACGPGIGAPRIRVARHRARISSSFQHMLWGKIVACWDTIQSGHIFNSLSREESLIRQATLDEYHKAYEGDDPNEKWFQEVTRERRGY